MSVLAPLPLAQTYPRLIRCCLCGSFPPEASFPSGMRRRYTGCWGCPGFRAAPGHLPVPFPGPLGCLADPSKFMPSGLGARKGLDPGALVLDPWSFPNTDQTAFGGLSGSWEVVGSP